MSLTPESDDIFALLNSLTRQNEQLEALNAYGQWASDAYWQQKDLPRFIAISKAGINYGASLAQSLQRAQPEKSRDILSAVKVMVYNLASFTWPGWEEPGIEIGASDLRMGLDAAKTNLRLAEQLEKDDLALSRAHWMLGAQYLANEGAQLATQHFQKAATYAARAETRSEELLASGFSILVSLSEEPTDDSLLTQLEECQSQLALEEHGVDFNGQINTARRVFIDNPKNQLRAFRTLKGFIVQDEPEMEIYFAYSATLRIFGDIADIDALTELLGVTPTNSHRKGEQLTQKSPPYAHDSWMYQSPLPEEAPLGEHIDHLWRVFEPHTAKLLELKERLTVDIFCGYRSNCDHAGVEIPPQNLKIFAQLQIPFGLSIIIA